MDAQPCKYLGHLLYVAGEVQSINFFVHPVQVEKGQPAAEANLQNGVAALALRQAQLHTAPVHPSKDRQIIKDD
jgi:hypothetical protein